MLMYVYMFVCMFMESERERERARERKRERAKEREARNVLNLTIPERESAMHRDARIRRIKDPEELQRPRRPCTRDLRAMLCFGVGGVELKPQNVRKSPLNENLLALCGLAASLCYGLGIAVS